ncbi:MAG: ECF transporter S component [Anaerolineae bacterium]|nr:ECF transporter S component [Candidatus Roseilinea sp.]MDW8449364.1 ECF transporter S component [Anaerolineae bacterium]
MDRTVPSPVASAATSAPRARRWTTRDLLVTAMIGVAFAVLLIPFTYAYAAAQAGGVLGRAVAGGLFFLPAAFAAYVMRKPGAVVLVGLISGLIAIPFTPFGLVVLGISVLTAVLAEPVVWVITRYRNYSWARIAALGFAVGLIEFLLIAIGIRSTRLELPVLVVAVALSAIGFLIAAIVGRLLADAVARTGVLAGTPLGQTLGEI